MGLLALLGRGDSYGYQLKNDFERSTGGLWPLNIGQVYSTLDRLEAAGLVTAEERPDEHGAAGGGDVQRWFSLTRKGELEVRDWFDRPDADEAPPRDGLQAKVLLALADGDDTARSVIATQRTTLTGILQRRRALQRRRHAGGDADAESVADDLVDEAVIARTEAALRWLDICDSRLAETSRSRPVSSRRK